MKNKKNGVGFKLLKISTDQYADFIENHLADNKEFGIGFDARISIDKSEKGVGVFTKFQFEQESKPVLVIECGCHFKFDEDYWRSCVTDDILTLDQKLLTHLLVLTVGTSRGIIHEKKPKWLPDLYLPTINITGLIKENYIFDLSQDEEKE